MSDRLAELVVRHPGIANIPVIFALLVFFAVLHSLFRNIPRAWPGQQGWVLAQTFKLGGRFLMGLCLLECVRLAQHDSLARGSLVPGPVETVAWGLAWLLVIVPWFVVYALANADKKWEKGKRLT